MLLIFSHQRLSLNHSFCLFNFECNKCGKTIFMNGNYSTTKQLNKSTNKQLNKSTNLIKESMIMIY